MAYFRTRYNNYRNGRRSYRYGYNKQRRISQSNKRAAAQQKDSLTLTLKYSDAFTVTSDNTNQPPGYTQNIYNALRRSPMYGAFASMYDQVKLNSCTVHVTQKYANASIQTPAAPLQIVTAWDRSGIEYSPTDEELQPNTYYNTAQRSSAFSKSALYGSSYKTTRTLYPSSIEEKGQYISTARLANADPAPEETDEGYPYTLRESGSYKFKPTFLLACLTQTTAAQNVQIAQFDIDYEIVVTFRGLRKIAVQEE